jgi:hypothetical protein
MSFIMWICGICHRPFDTPKASSDHQATAHLRTSKAHKPRAKKPPAPPARKSTPADGQIDEVPF